MPQSFTVKVKNKLDDSEMTLSVSANSNIRTQEDAEAHVAAMPTSHGGKHPGLEVLKAAPVVLVDPATVAH